LFCFVNACFQIDIYSGLNITDKAMESHALKNIVF